MKAPVSNEVREFVEKIQPPTRKQETEKLIDIMYAATQKEAVLYAKSIISFGMYHYKYPTGTEGDTCIVGFSPRKDKFSLYLTGMMTLHTEQLTELGKFQTGKGCLYIKKLDDIHVPALQKLVSACSADYKKALAMQGIEVREK
ncbi:MAG: DUF1801 domain-containing protein [Ignavibacteria bacterium]|nr:DUF1801 domain-containing protein [Ignavibacteria bacterium]